MFEGGMIDWVNAFGFLKDLDLSKALECLVRCQARGRYLMQNIPRKLVTVQVCYYLGVSNSFQSMKLDWSLGSLSPQEQSYSLEDWVLIFTTPSFLKTPVGKFLLE